MNRKFFVNCVFLIILSVFLTGCVPNFGSNAGTREGQEEYVKGAFVPGFPNLPYYENSTVIESYGRDSNHGATLVTGDDLPKVVNFYQDALEKLEWDATVSGAGTNFTFDIKNVKHIGTVIINTAADNRRTVITISVSPR